MHARQLTAEEESALTQGLKLAVRIAQADRALSIPQVQKLYDDFLEEKINLSEAIIALGLSFGQCLKSRLDLEWVRIICDDGDETGLAVRGMQLFVFPISMMQKRLDRQEPLNIERLCSDTVDLVQAKLTSGEYVRR